jgi:hypothetical protein
VQITLNWSGARGGKGAGYGSCNEAAGTSLEAQVPLDANQRHRQPGKEREHKGLEYSTDGLSKRNRVGFRGAFVLS